MKSEKYMRRFLFFVCAAAAGLAMNSCGKKTVQQEAEVEPDTTAVVYVNRDTTLYGLCGDGSAMNTLQLITDVGDTVVLSIAEANDMGRCYGGFQSGDRMAVILKDESTALMVINQSAMLGDWVMPNPMDGSSEMGIRIMEGGIAESIDQPSVIFRSWKLFNGKLEIVSVREGGAEKVETNFYDIVSIGPDSLVFKDSEDTYEYSRYQPQEEHSKVKLEESSMDDFKM